MNPLAPKLVPADSKYLWNSYLGHFHWEGFSDLQLPGELTPLSLVYLLYPTYNHILKPIILYYSTWPPAATPPHLSGSKPLQDKDSLLIFVIPVPRTVTGSWEMPCKYWSTWFEMMRVSVHKPFRTGVFRIYYASCCLLVFIKIDGKTRWKASGSSSPRRFCGLWSTLGRRALFREIKLFTMLAVPNLLPSQAGTVHHSMSSSHWNGKGSSESHAPLQYFQGG